MNSRKGLGLLIKSALYFLAGAFFSYGLLKAGMAKRANIYGFLTLNDNWNPSLLIVLMTGVFINFILFNVGKALL